MKKKIFLLGFVSIVLIAFVFRDKFKDVLYSSNLPEPTSIAFEKQMPLYSYDWKLVGPSGRSLYLVEYMDRNVIINYWSPNAPESVEELKAWNKLYEDYKNDVFFIFVTKDSQSDVNSFIKDKGYLFPVYFSSSTPPKSIVLDKMPKSYLITKSGRIVVDHAGAANWNSDNFRKILDNLIKNN